jgi:two-component system cell cycle sensor histidine kinase PleC
MNEITAEMIERGRGPDQRIIAQRRKLTARLRAAREKLASSGVGTRAFAIHLLLQLAQARLAARHALYGLAVICAAAATLWAGPGPAGAWCAAVCLALLASNWLARKLASAPRDRLPLETWTRRLTLMEGAQALAWCALAPVTIGPTPFVAQAALSLCLLAVSAIHALTGASVPRVAYVGLTPTGAAIAMLVLSGGRDSLPFALMACAAPVFFVYVVRALYAAKLVSLSSQLEKDALIGELAEAKSNSDEARRRAEEASLAKSRFLATMSHELRTPLNAILGFSEVMKEEMFGAHSAPAYKEYSADIHSSGQHLLGLINEILDLSRVEAGRYELKEEAISLAGVVEDCLHLVSLRAQNRGVALREAMEAGQPRIWADERAVRQVALNLLTNAIKFTPSGGLVTVKVGWTAAGGQYLAIRDTGPGIPPEEIPIVLSSFGRGSMALKNADEGTGLGLPIVKGLVELHGGSFTLRSEVRVGTEAVVIFPPERVMDALPLIEGEPSPRRRAA